MRYQLDRIEEALKRIEIEFKIIELRRWVDSDLRQLGHLSPNTIKAISDSGYADKFGYTNV